MDFFKTVFKKIKTLVKSVFSLFLIGFLFVYKKIKKQKTNVAYQQKELDRKLVYSLSKSRVPNFRQLKYIGRFLNSTEIKIIYICFLIIFGSLIFGGANFYQDHLQQVPKKGGVYVEGVVGSPKYINPLYASVSDVDNDIASLVYSSLFKHDKDGKLVNDLVEDYQVSEDNKEYTIRIKPDVKWHHIGKLTADDIVFTFTLIRDSQFKSPLRSSFIGVNIEKIDDQTVKFSLADPYAAFTELLTFGIMPADIWQQVTPETASLAEWNLKPVGSGPYKFDKLVKDKNGAIKEYELVVNEDYYGKQPYIDINFRFFGDFPEAIAALNDDAVNGISYLPLEYKNNIITPNTYNFHKLLLPQINVIFFNQKNNAVLAEKNVRQALAMAIDKNKIVSEELDNQAEVVNGPILKNSFAYSENAKSYEYNPEEAIKLLDANGWKKTEVTAEEVAALEEKKSALPEENEEKAELTTEEENKLQVGVGDWFKKNNDFLIIKLTTVERAENIKIVEAVKKFWEEIGVKTELEIMPPTQVQSEKIRGRDFQALFYGQVLGADPDPYAFWHSSQTGENGYNIADYADKKVDQLLEDARLTSNVDERKEKYAEFQKILTEQAPVIFLYSPVYTYVQDKNVKGFSVKSLLSPRDRFSNIEEWYINTKKSLVW